MSQSGKIVYTPPAINNLNIHHNTGEYDVTIVPQIPSLRNMPIRWDDSSAIPETLRNITLGQLLTNPVTSSSIYTTSITLTGQQGSLINGPYTDITITDGSLVITTRFVTTPPASLHPPGIYDSDFRVNATYPKFGVLTGLTLVNHSNDVGYAYDVYGMTLTITVDVTLVVSCTGDQLDTPTCIGVCQGGSSACLTSYSNYCFPTRIGTDTVCQNYFKDYIENNGPSTVVDEGLSKYCTKYTGFKDLFEQGTKEDIDLCACHMPKQQYINYTNELFKEHPELSTIPGIINLCLVPDCLNSPYPAIPIPKGGCKTPNCVVIGEFNNDGTFNNSTINENVSGCGSDPEDNSWSVMDIIIILIVLIIIIIIVAAVISSTRYSKSFSSSHLTSSSVYNNATM